MIVITIPDIIVGVLIALMLLAVLFQWISSWFDKKD